MNGLPPRDTGIIELRFDAGRPRRWMRRMMARLSDLGSPVQVAWVETGAERAAGLEALFDLERMLLRRGQPCGADADGTLKQETRLPLQKPAIVIDFTAAPRPSGCGARHYFRPLHDGEAGEDAALAAILAGDLPLLEIVDEASGAIVRSGRPSSETADGLGGALDTVMARTGTLLAAALTAGPWPGAARPRAVARRDRAPAAYVLRGIAMHVVRQIYRMCCYSPHWRIGWRLTDDAGIWAGGNLSGSPWRALPSPVNRFYADPFPMSWRGRTFVFFEDLDHRVGKGTISAIEFGPDGPVGDVVRVLEEPWHLSYPFVMAHGGELWMIPESSLQREVTLYRCVEFPARWERHATLLSGIELADATLVEHDGLSYLLGATRDGDGGYSDTLSIYYAAGLFGPWQPHAKNPVLLDRAAVRPAGHFMRSGGRLWRPAQDCTHGYGWALALAEVTALSPETFAQEVRHTIRPGPLWPGHKLHTLNRCGRLELIDGTIIRPRIAPLRLLDPLRGSTAAAAG